MLTELRALCCCGTDELTRVCNVSGRDARDDSVDRNRRVCDADSCTFTDDIDIVFREIRIYSHLKRTVRGVSADWISTQLTGTST